MQIQSIFKKKISRPINGVVKKEIDDCLKSINTIHEIHDSFEVIKSFIQSKDDLLNAQEDFQNLQDFYIHQRESWETLLNAVDCQLNTRGRTFGRIQNFSDFFCKFSLV